MSKTGSVFLIAVALASAFVTVPAEARRGGSFGSRGSRTYYAPSATRLTPRTAPGIERSMTAQRPMAPQYAPAYRPQPSPGFTRPGFGGGFLGGLVTGGLIGAMMGHGFGGGGWGSSGGAAGGGFLALLFQLALLGGGIWLVMRLFRSNRAPANQAAAFQSAPQGYDPAPQPYSSGGYAAPQSDIELSGADRQMFERLLMDLQSAFGREDYAGLRAITTPEIMSYLAEELSDNATHGRRNDVSATRLLEAEIAEAWEEDGNDYATVAMRYESIDLMRDRVSGAVQSGDPARPTETTELWTFVRPAGAWAAWKVSAIQEA